MIKNYCLKISLKSCLIALYQRFQIIIQGTHQVYCCYLNQCITNRYKFLQCLCLFVMNNPVSAIVIICEIPLPTLPGIFADSCVLNKSTASFSSPESSRALYQGHLYSCRNLIEPIKPHIFELTEETSSFSLRKPLPF